MDSIPSIFTQVKQKYNLPFELKEKQAEAIEKLICNEDVLCVLPTGFGKSYTYALIAGRLSG